jgi:CheY-like chemotaxis protein
MARNVLYIEDDPDSVIFLERVVNKLGDYKLHIYENGDQLLKNLQATKDDIKPEMILLDINLPGMNGFEILEYLRTRKEYKHVPVIMFTSSENEKDIEKSYENGANAYLVKPDNLKMLHNVLEDTFNFWLKHNVA